MTGTGYDQPVGTQAVAVGNPRRSTGGGNADQRLRTDTPAFTPRNTQGMDNKEHMQGYFKKPAVPSFNGDRTEYGYFKNTWRGMVKTQFSDRFALARHKKQ